MKRLFPDIGGHRGAVEGGEQFFQLFLSLASLGKILPGIIDERIVRGHNSIPGESHCAPPPNGTLLI